MPDPAPLSPKKIAIAVVALLAIGAGAFLVANQLAGSDNLAAKTERRTMVDAKTGEVFEDLRLPSGAPIPYTNPNTGEDNLFPAEACFWNADGSAKLEPAWVLLNEFKGEPGPTICPDCGRRVVAHNPMPPDNLLVEAAERQGG